MCRSKELIDLGSSRPQLHLGPAGWRGVPTDGVSWLINRAARRPRSCPAQRTWARFRRCMIRCSRSATAKCHSSPATGTTTSAQLSHSGINGSPPRNDQNRQNRPTIRAGGPNNHPAISGDADPRSEAYSSSLILSATRTVGLVSRFIGVVLADCLGSRTPSGVPGLLPPATHIPHLRAWSSSVAGGVQAASRLARAHNG